MKRYEVEFEVIHLYSVQVLADSLEHAAKKAKLINTVGEIEERGDRQDVELNLVGVSRQTDRKMYQ